ncbi:hypothetical protein Mapa_000086 [Marchantia paleacea]|nr:hypothetical protein Mapa_000086 [Marchantia paleacea]
MLHLPSQSSLFRHSEWRPRARGKDLLWGILCPSVRSDFWPLTFCQCNITPVPKELYSEGSPSEEGRDCWSGGECRSTGLLRFIQMYEFAVDDGTGCVPCILWTNHYKSTYFAHWKESDLELQAGIADTQAKTVKLGCLLRVMGRLSGFRSQIQITVLSTLEEKDPNAEVFHWLQCMKLALSCYDLPFPSRPVG